MSCTSFLLCFFAKKHNNDNNKLNNELKKKQNNKCLSGSSSGPQENSLKFLKRDSISVSSEYSELKYWFSEFIKYVIKDDELHHYPTSDPLSLQLYLLFLRFCLTALQSRQTSQQ
jgi:hypothetical protein